MSDHNKLFSEVHMYKIDLKLENKLATDQLRSIIVEKSKQISRNHIFTISNNRILTQKDDLLLGTLWLAYIKHAKLWTW